MQSRTPKVDSSRIPQHELLTRQQVASLVGLSVNSIQAWSWRYRNKLPLHESARSFCELEIRVGRTVRYPREGVIGWLQLNAYQSRKNRPESTQNFGEKIIALADEARAARQAHLAIMLYGIGRFLEI